MSLLPTIIIFAVPAFFGITLLSSLKLFREKIVLLLSGTIVGLTVFTTLAYLSVPLMPLSGKSIFFLLILLLGTTIYLLQRTAAWSHWQSRPVHFPTLIVLILLVGLFSLIAPKLLIVKTDGLFTGVINAWGDLGWHMSNITLLRDNTSLIPEDPILAGTKLTYPFLSNFFSAILLAGGASFSLSVVAPALVLIPLTLALFYCLVRAVTTNKHAALIALLLFLFGGSTLGWLQLPTDWSDSGQPLFEFLTHLTKNYSGHSDNPLNLHLINPIISLLLPQRSFLFGIPLGFTILLLLLSARRPGGQRRNNIPAFFMAGILAGLLPLFHAHTVLALIPAIIIIFLFHPGRSWIYFFLPAFIIGLPEILLYKSGLESPGAFISWKPGWMAYPDGQITYWLKNSGLILPITLLGLILPAPKMAKRLALAGLILFIAADLWLFAPWEWDNTKLFVFWLLFTLPLVSWVAARALYSRSLIIKSAAFALLIFHLASGGLDIWQLALPQGPTWLEWDNNAIAIAARIRAATEPGDTILTAPIHNSAAALSGRAVYLGYPGQVWTHGKNHWDREKDIRRFLSGNTSALVEIMPDYVLIGPTELNLYSSLRIRPDWDLVAEENNYSLFKLRQ